MRRARSSPRHRPVARSVEPLEPRLALAALTFNDVDGDLITLTTSKGSNFSLLAAVTRTDFGGGRYQIAKIDLSFPEFAGTNLAVTAARVGKGGDGLVNVGEIFAEGRDLGTVTVRGDVGRLRAGDANAATKAISSFTASSLGRLGTTTGAPDLQTVVVGGVDSFTVNGDVVNASIELKAGLTGTVGTVVVKGSIIGSGDGTGVLFVNNTNGRKAGSLTVGGSIRGGTGLLSGVVQVAAAGSLKVGGGVWGGGGNFSGSLIFTSVDTVTVGGSVVGGAGEGSGGLDGRGGKIGTLSIGGDVVGGSATFAGAILSDGIASVTIGGDLVGGAAESTGVLRAKTLDKVVIGGSVFGGSGIRSGVVLGGYSPQLNPVGPTGLGTVTVAGDLVGGYGEESGVIRSECGDVIGLTSATIGGSIRGGEGQSSGKISSVTSIKTATVKGSIRGGGGNQSGCIEAGFLIDTVTVGGSVVGGVGAASGFVGMSPSSLGTLGTVTIGGSLVGGLGLWSGRLQGAKGTVKSIAVGRSLVGGVGESSGLIDVSPCTTVGKISVGGMISGGIGASSGGMLVKNVDAVAIGGSLVGGVATGSGSVLGAGGKLGMLTIGGDVVGGSAVDAGAVRSDAIASVTIGGDLVGGPVAETGSVKAARLDKVSIGGSVFGGAGADSGAVWGTDTLGAVTVTGDLVGGAGVGSGEIRSDSGLVGLASATVSGSIRGGAGAKSGQINIGTTAKTIMVKGSVRGGDGPQSGALVAGIFETVSVAGSVVGGVGTESGRIGVGFPFGGLGTVTIGGSLVGGLGVSSGRLQGGLGTTKSITIGRSLVGGFGENSGTIEAASLVAVSKLSVGGTIESGSGLHSAQVLFGILNQLEVKGAIRGTATRPVRVIATGLKGATPAIGSIKVDGNLERCLVTTGSTTLAEPNARIGSVTIGGGMIASSIASAASNPFGVYGNEDDASIVGNESAIGTVTVTGRIVGSAGVETFGIVARSLGTIKAEGTTLGAPAAGELEQVGSSNVFLHRLA